MRILWVHEKMGAFGGAEANVLATATALAERGHANLLACLERTGIENEPWDAAFSGLRILSAASDLAEVARDWKPDVVWVHNWPESASFSALIDAGFPVGRMVHDHALYCLRHYKYHPLTRKNCTRPASLACVFPCMAFLQRGNGRLPVRLASLRAKFREIADNRAVHRVVVASGFMRGELEKNGFSAAKIRILPPVPPPAAGVWSRELPPDPDWVEGRILFIGQVIRGKGVDLLLRALHGLTGRWQFSLAGRGSALPAVRSLIRDLGLEERVTLHGHLSPAELSREYREAQVVVVPSAWQEPFGMVGIEAMRHARPVLAFAVGGIPDWLRDGVNGRLVPPGDVTALRTALHQLLADPAGCRRMGAAGWELARSEFSFKHSIDRLDGFLHELALLG